MSVLELCCQALLKALIHNPNHQYPSQKQILTILVTFSVLSFPLLGCGGSASNPNANGNTSGQSGAPPSVPGDSNVSAAPSSSLTVQTFSLSGGTMGTHYEAVLQATGGTPGYTWKIASGYLPPGLTLGAMSGKISGTSSSSGKYSFTVAVEDSASPAQTASRSFAINMTAPGPLKITTAWLPSVTVGVPYSARLAANGGIEPYTWSISAGKLPSGLSLSPTGRISGIPTERGIFSLSVMVTDSSP